MSAIISNAFKKHAETVIQSEKELLLDIEKSAQILFDALKNGNRVLVCGNGGSSADSQHFAGELMCKYKDNRNPLPGIALTVDTSALTAISNDFGFEIVFQRQVQALGREGDVLVAITTSGKSKNILRAIEQAKTQGMKVLVLTGRLGEFLKDTADAAVVVPSEETARIQEVHELVYHIWCEFIDANI